MELARAHPGWPDGRPPPPGWVDPGHGWMIVSRVTRGGRQSTRNAIERDKRAISGHLGRHAPLERWELVIRTVPDTWCDRELSMRFLGTLTPDEHVADLAERQALYERRMAAAAEKRAKKALEARLRARAEQEQNRARGAREG